MKILVTGATGTVGSAVVRELIHKRVAVRALARRPPEAGKFPDAVEVALGDLLDPVSVETALRGVDKLFLLNAVTPDELTQALIAYGLARRLGIQHVTYLSVFKVDQFADVPHFASKLAVEGALRQFGVPFTILRPGYFYQNDLRLKDALTGAGIYPTPLGEAGVAAVDVRDIAEAAALTLTRDGHAGKTYNLVGDVLTGPGVAETWARALDRPVRYPGENFDAWEQQMRAFLPAWSAYDLRAMFQGYVERGFGATATEIEGCARLLGRAPRSYKSLAGATAAAWQA